jgi:hypothetical protein
MKHIITLLILVISFSITAQVKESTLSTEQENEIKTMFKAYLSELKNETKDWDKILDFTYSKLFDLSSKEDIKTQMKGMFNNSAFYTTFDVMNYKSAAKTFIFENVTYSKINYQSQFTFHFIKSDEQKDDEFDEYVGFMHSILKKKQADLNVIRQGNNIIFSGNKIMLAVFDKTINSWKILEYIKDNNLFYEMFLPKAVAQNL